MPAFLYVVRPPVAVSITISSDVSVLKAASVPLLPEAVELARQGFFTGASARNWASYGDAVRLSPGLPDWKRDLLTDPQTSGGLLIAVAPEAAGAVLDLVRGQGFRAAAVVGRLLAGPAEVRVG